MKKNLKALFAGCLAVVMSAGSLMAADNVAPNAGKVGAGYQGVFAGDILQGVSARYWATNEIGVEGNFFYGDATVGMESTDTDLFDGSFYLGTAKVMYAPVVNQNSRFYIGLEGGIGAVDAEFDEEEWPYDVDVYVLNPLIGAEHYFSEFPELGFNWEVGYKMHMIDAGVKDVDDKDLEIDLNGISVALGAHYYF
ncbi:MAG: hypothetical protein UMU76_00295 [Prosthecochloris sp.]|nr:hypothetical protein [Prosthecochloris sp.]